MPNDVFQRHVEEKQTENKWHDFLCSALPYSLDRLCQAIKKLAKAQNAQRDDVYLGTTANITLGNNTI